MTIGEFWQDIRELPRESWVLFFATLINRAGTMVLPFLVLYLNSRLELSLSQAGLVVAIYGVGAMLTGPFAGHLADRFGGLLVMKLSLFLSGVVLFVMLAASSFLAISAVTALWAIVSEAFRPASLSILTGIVRPEQRKTAVSVNRLAINLGMSTGPAAAGFLAMVSFEWLFIIDASTSLLAAAVLTLSPWRTGTTPSVAGSKTTVERNPETKAPGLSAVRANPGEPGAIRTQVAVESQTPDEIAGVDPRRRELLYFLAALLPSLMIFFQSHAAMPFFLVRQLNITEGSFGLLLTINTVLIIFLEVPLNAAMARWPHHHSMALGALLTGAGFGALAFVNGFWTAGITVAIWTFGEMILFPASSAYIADIAPDERRGSYMGLFQMTFSVAFAAGPWLGTQLLDAAGPRVLWGATFLLGCLSAVLLFRFSRTHLML
jgi:MFS family permease